MELIPNSIDMGPEGKCLRENAVLNTLTVTVEEKCAEPLPGQKVKVQTGFTAVYVNVVQIQIQTSNIYMSTYAFTQWEKRP